MSNLRERMKSFLKETETEIVDAQKEVASTAMKKLFYWSPHHDPEGYKEEIKYAKGEYDANHRVTSESISMSAPSFPTFSLAISRMINNGEIDKIQSIENIGETITIQNVCDHAKDVEYGGNRWTTKGYYTYTSTKDSVVDRFGDLLSES